MAGLDYDDYRVVLTPGDEGIYSVRAVGPDGAEATGTFRLPFGDTEFARAVVDVGRSAEAPPVTRDVGVGAVSPPIDAETLGGALASALLTGDVRAGYDAARARAASSDRGVRLTLSLGAAPALLSVPWELLYRAPTFLANQRRTPVVRHLAAGSHPAALAITGPVRVLAVAANPDDSTPLDVAAERRRVEQAVAPMVAEGRVVLDWLEPATPRRLREVLRDGSYHVLHYIGHGDFTASGEGVLYLESPDGGHAELDSAELASLLADQESLRLVMLNSCDGARTTLTDPFAGVATTLVQLGVPAVIGMQFAISDSAAILFAEELYTNLIGRQTTVDAAVSEARKAIYVEQGTVEWATPVLFLGETDGELFRWTPAAPPPAPRPSRPSWPDRRATLKPPSPPTTHDTTRRWGRSALIAAALLFAAIIAGLVLTSRDDDPEADSAPSTGPRAGTPDPSSPTSAASTARAPDVAPLADPVTIEGEITAGGDQQRFPITLAAGQLVYVAADVTCGADLTYEIDLPSGPLATGYARRVCDDVGRFEVTEAGEHTVLVQSNGGATGPFAFTITPVRPDPSDPLTVGSAAVGTIDAPGEWRRYTVELRTGDLLYLDGRGECGAMLLYQLVAPSGTPLVGYDMPVCQDGGRITIAESGTHELRVFGTLRATGPYDVMLTTVRPDGGGALTVGRAATGTIDEPGARDEWLFTASEGDTFSLEPQLPCGSELRYEVLSPMASSISLLGFAYRTCDVGTFTAIEDGVHTVVVYGETTATGPYDLVLVPG